MDENEIVKLFSSTEKIFQLKCPAKIFECKEIFICLLSWYSPSSIDPGSTVSGLGRADTGTDPPPLKHKMRNENCSSWSIPDIFCSHTTGKVRNISLAPTSCHYCNLLQHPSIFSLEGEFWVEDHAQSWLGFPNRNYLIFLASPRVYF